MRIQQQEDGATKYTVATGHNIVIAPFADIEGGGASQAQVIVNVALDAANALAEKTHSAVNDARLTKIGREQSLADIQAKTLKQIAMHYGQVQAFQKSVDDMRALHLKLPAIGPALALNYFEDRELRGWWRDACEDDRQFVFDHAADDPQCARVLVALLHDPVPLARNPEAKRAAEAWARVRDAAEPLIAAELEGRQRAADWAADSVALIAAIVLQLVTTYGGRNSFELLALLLADEDERVRGNAALYGWSAAQVANGQRIMAANAMEAA